MNPNTTLSSPISRNALTRWSVTAAVALATATAAFAQSPPPRYAVVELPTPAGYEFSVPYQINDQGFVAGSSTLPNDPSGLVATVWKGGTVTLLGRLPKGTYSIASAINSKGVVTGEGDDGDDARSAGSPREGNS